MGRAWDVFPPELMDPDKVDDVVLFLLRLPIAVEDKKQLLIEWCLLMGVELTRDLVERAGAEEAAP